MPNHDNSPIFPDSYVGDNSSEYDNSIWMERNQKKSTLVCLQYLYDEKLNALGKVDCLNEKNYLIADLGCGTGFSSEILVENGYRVIGIDILKDMISKAKIKKSFLKRGRELELILADINHLPIRLASIDHMISISAYNFITQGKKLSGNISKTTNNTAKYLKKILKTNGRIVIEFYPKDEKELNYFISSFKDNGFDGFMVKKDPNQKTGQTFLLLKKR
ncbi:MAG: class I SAM-dependent methyltransferase [Candidatus Lokiarchaeota archaeon]|jgi:SAM-dependent methyltransferase|nr:class I SAM-dependent methyltransferase [Candidatus Lokiarchaeota archaeon]